MKIQILSESLYREFNRVDWDCYAGSERLSDGNGPYIYSHANADCILSGDEDSNGGWITIDFSDDPDDDDTMHEYGFAVSDLSKAYKIFDAICKEVKSGVDPSKLVKKYRMKFIG